MVHVNHNRSFWRLVGKITPDYKGKWLTLSNMNV
ncbi:M48 family metallopeptidase [Metabacillus halosaccharovorans]|nr:M48 family metallopeptidase [Metabacillus halosaccharovorans]